MLHSLSFPARFGLRALRPVRLMKVLGLARSRRRLAALEDHLLRDIGLTREEAAREAARRLWDAPGHWLQ
ncbi:MAG: DUF1127 domain-containing protein [Roseinatronobacter sp.]